MYDKLYNFFKKIAKLKFIIIFIFLFLIFNIFILPYVGNKITSQSRGTGPIDLRFFYTPQEVYLMLENYSDEIRSFYAVFEMTGDVIYPIITFLMLISIITILIDNIFKNTGTTKFLTIFPIITLASDFFENICIITMLLNYPNKLMFIPNIACFFTMTKWASFFVALVIILLLIAAFIIKKLKSVKKYA